MTTTTKISNGLAFSQDKDLQMFADMAAQGKRLVGFGALGHGWKFADAPPEQAVFDIAYENNPDPGYFDIFAAAGWTHVLSAGSLHIFKAVPGTAPVHTAKESRREELITLRNHYALWATIALALCAAVLTGVYIFNTPRILNTVLSIIAIVPVVYTVLPLVGISYRLRKV
ncbi:MAG: DUF2812 domain-containing protein [Actinomycetaceae bacterium]|nr:DUF2812 domain-containing protein [Actinomycetaceae bacterium]